VAIEINDSGEFEDGVGRIYVRCNADPSGSFFVDVTTNYIEAEWRRARYYIDLNKYQLPVVIIDVAKKYLVHKLESVCPRILSSVQAGLSCLEGHWEPAWKDFSDVSLGKLLIVMTSSPAGASEFRRLYIYAAFQGLAGADEIHALELEAIRLKKPHPTARILEWHETHGALTSSEIEVIRKEMMISVERESMADITARLFTWILFETLKRPIQLHEMSRDALWVPDSAVEDVQYFLRIPKAKYQTGQAPELWPITAQLANAILEYSSSPMVKLLQEKTGRLLVSSREGKSSNFGRSITGWCRRLKLISPRTNKPLMLTPYRIRHSGATQMAAQGASRDEIQYVLEHDSVYAADAYIDCLASDFCPLLERANRKLGGIFSELNGLFFAGQLGQKSSGAPILIPVVNQPAIVGECGKAGSCGQHPFFNCYNGCRYFVAWRDADHKKSLDYLESELERWGRAEGGKERSKILKELERVYQAVKDVVARINNGE